MDWLNITLWGFAIVGVIFVILVIIVALSEAFGSGSTAPDFSADWRSSSRTEVLQEEQTWYNDRHYLRQVTRSIDPDHEPTLLGRVEAIEKHLGVEVYVKPAVDEKLAVRKRK